jgi:hypothetical protein
MPSDEKKPDLNHEQEFEKWDREHRKPTSPEPEEEVYVLSDAERAGLRAGARLALVWNAMHLTSPANKARQKAIAEESAKIMAELDTGREKGAVAIPQRTIEPDPKPADKKPPAVVVKIDAATISKDTAPDPKASNRPPTVEEITKTARKDKVVQLYDLLKRLGDLPNIYKSEPALRAKFEDAFKPLWDAIDQSPTLTVRDRKLFFRQITNAGERERYEFIANILGSTADTVRSWRFPRRTKKKKHA